MPIYSLFIPDLVTGVDAFLSTGWIDEMCSDLWPRASIRERIISEPPSIVPEDGYARTPSTPVADGDCQVMTASAVDVHGPFCSILCANSASRGPIGCLEQSLDSDGAPPIPNGALHIH